MKPLYLRRKLADEHESVLPHSAKRIEFDYLLIAALTLGVILWILTH